MIVRILSDCMADGRHLPCGELVDISDEAARSLIAIGRAEHSSVTVEHVATAVTTTDAELAESAPARPAARRGRPAATPTTNTEED